MQQRFMATGNTTYLQKGCVHANTPYYFMHILPKN